VQVNREGLDPRDFHFSSPGANVLWITWSCMSRLKSTNRALFRVASYITRRREVDIADRAQQGVVFGVGACHAGMANPDISPFC